MPIHTNHNAVQTSRDIKARAFRTHHNIAFNLGEYQPGTTAGRHLLAHETHTIQQGAAGELLLQPAAEESDVSQEAKGSVLSGCSFVGQAREQKEASLSASASQLAESFHKSPAPEGSLPFASTQPPEAANQVEALAVPPVSEQISEQGTQLGQLADKQTQAVASTTAQATGKSAKTEAGLSSTIKAQESAKSKNLVDMPVCSQLSQ